MKTIGILGGMGSNATCYFFAKLIEAYKVEKEWERPRILIDNNCIMPSRVRAILYEENVEQLIKEMAKSIEWLIDGGADVIIIGCITAHYFLEYMPYKERILDLRKLVSQAIKGNESILVLCTEGSAKVNVWKDVLSGKKYEYPEVKQLETLRWYIEVVKQGNVNKEIKEEFVKYIESFDEPIVILGCTELPILLEGMAINKIIIDPIELAITKLAKGY